MAIPPPSQWHLLPKSHREALAQGASHYFTSRPCKHGHLEPRNTKSKGCTACGREQGRLQREAGIRQLTTDGYYTARREYKRTLPSNSPEAISALTRQRHLQRRTAIALRIDRRPPNQQTREARKAIRDFEKAIKARGNEPDHVVQFQHPQIRGLHTLANLQELTPRQNRIKGRGYNGQYSPEQIVDFIRRGMAVLIEDVDEETGKVNWARYPQHQKG